MTTSPSKEITPIQLAVWPGLAPGETTSSPGRLAKPEDKERLTDVTAAQLFVYPLPDHRQAPAILICPGGGYQILSTYLEGKEIAAWLNHLGYVAAVLHYRVPNQRAGALQDAQRAMSVLRARAGDFGIDPKHLGVMGFSAGGHLSAHLSVVGDKKTYASVDAMDQESCRPDFTLLIYPAYLMEKTGEPAPEVLPHAGMPPLFLAQSRDDPYFCIEGYAQFLEKVGVKEQKFVYERGGHGYGLRQKSDIPSAHWPIDAAQWLKEVAPLP